MQPVKMVFRKFEILIINFYNNGNSGCCDMYVGQNELLAIVIEL